MTEDNDSSELITTSLLVASPGKAIYSTFGHCALRMESPQHNLDYCFSLEMDAQPGDYLKFFTGQSKARVVAVPSSEFIDSYAEEGRGVSQHPLNLTIEEKQLLWKQLDEEMMKAPHLTFNLLKTNCAMMCILMIENALIREHIDFKDMPMEMTLNNGDLLRYCSSHAPWSQFVYMIFYGAVSDEFFETEYRMSPNMMVEVLQGAVIAGNDTTSVRPLLTGSHQQLIAQADSWQTSPFTPTLFFSIILLIMLIITIGEWCFGWYKLAYVTDVILLMIQTLTGIIVLYASVFANLFGNRWNWYLIPFNPLPILCWTFFHKKPEFWKIYLLYSLILLVFLALTPFTSQLDFTHQLLTLIMLTRTISCYLFGRKQNKLKKVL